MPKLLVKALGFAKTILDKHDFPLACELKVFTSGLGFHFSPPFFYRAGLSSPARNHLMQPRSVTSPSKCRVGI